MEPDTKELPNKKIREILDVHGVDVSKDLVDELSEFVVSYFDHEDIEYHAIPNDTDLSSEQISMGAKLRIMASLAEQGRTLVEYPQIMMEYGREDQPQTPTKIGIVTRTRPLHKRKEGGNERA